MASKHREILSALKTLFEGITTGNGYNNTIQKVYRAPQSVTNMPEIPGVEMLDGEEDPIPETNQSYRSTLTIPITAVVECDSDDSRTGTASDAIQDLIEDFKKAIDADTRLGLSYVISAHLRNIAPFPIDRRPYFMAEVVVDYKYNKGNP